MEFLELKFKNEDTTADRLVKATQALIARYGYDATTTRMIASLAQVNLSAINFHFGSKENLVREAVVKASEKLCRYYQPLADEIYAFLKEEPNNKEKAWGYIDRYLADRIRRAFDYKHSWINIGIVEHENGLPEHVRGIMSESMIRINEQVLAELILAVSDKKDVFQAALISRSINASIMSYIEKPLLNQYMERIMGIGLDDPDRVEEYFHSYFMKSIEAAVVIHPCQKMV